MTLSIAEALQQGNALGLDGLDVQVLLSFVLQKNRTHLIAFPERLLTADQLQHFLALLTRRAHGEPVAYLMGEKEFWSLSILTQPSTLIPRPDTEVLVETVLAHYDQTPMHCLDLGTGTGAIALAIKSERPLWVVTGIDRITDAVDLARLNAERLALEVSFSQGDWCQGILDQSLDIIVSNPPYIDADDIHLGEGDVRFEPQTALVSDEHGLADIRRIVHQATRCLKTGGGLFLEHGWTQSAAVSSLLKTEGFNAVKTVKDYGGNDRVTFGYLIDQP